MTSHFKINQQNKFFSNNETQLLADILILGIIRIRREPDRKRTRPKLGYR